VSNCGLVGWGGAESEVDLFTSENVYWGLALHISGLRNAPYRSGLTGTSAGGLEGKRMFCTFEGWTPLKAVGSWVVKNIYP
jgi:hypothetical protein